MILREFFYLAERAGPHQVVLTEDLRAMVDRGGVTFEPLGEVALKGIASPVALFEVVRADEP